MREKNEMERSVLFFDIDGTILSEITKEIPKDAIEALKAAQAAGHLLFINTGRTVCSIPSEIRRLKFDGYLCGCGTYLLYGDELLFDHGIPEERGREIIRKAAECRLDCVAEGREDIYFPERFSRFENLEQSRRYFRARGLAMGQTLEKGGYTYDKLFVYSDTSSDLKTFLDFIEEDMEAIDRGGDTYEVIQKGYSKATACEFILERLGIPKERAYVFHGSSLAGSRSVYRICDEDSGRRRDRPCAETLRIDQIGKDSGESFEKITERMAADEAFCLQLQRI